MPSYQISLTPHKQAAGRFISKVRRELQKALAEEHLAHGTTQASIATALDVNRSVIHRQIVGHENLTLGRVGEIAEVLGRTIVFALVKPEECSNYHTESAAPASQAITAPFRPSPLPSGTTASIIQRVVGRAVAGA